MRTTCLIAGFTLTAFIATGAASAADPRLMNLVMPDASIVAGVNVTNARITPFGQYVLSQMTSTINQQMQSFVTATGFDPRQDVTEIVAASSGNITSPTGLAVAIGNFQVAQLAAAITVKTPDLSVQLYNGTTLITSTGKDGSYSIAFFGTTIAAVGDTASVKAAIDRSPNVNSINPALATQVQALSTTQDAWVVTTNPVSTLLAGLTGAAPSLTTGATPTTASPMSQFTQMFNSIQASSGGVKFGANVQITGQAITTDPANAKSLADVLTALASIAAMGAGQNPQMASMAQLMQSLKVTADGTAINLALSVPESQLESILNSMKTPQAKPAAKAAIRPAMTPKADRVAGSSAKVN